MKRLHLILLAAGLVAGWAGTPAWACRYNVLEVGFIDLETEPYRLFGYVTSQMTPEKISTLRDEIETALVESNVRFELVHTDHNYWFSYYTTINLLRKCGLRIDDLFVYSFQNLKIFSNKSRNIFHFLKSLCKKIVVRHLYTRTSFWGDGLIVISKIANDA